MIALPGDILDDVIEAVTDGRPVDYIRVAKLQALAVAKAGEQFVRDELRRQEEADGQLSTD